MDDLERRVADEFRRHHWGSCWPQCTDNEATLAARAIIPMVLEHAAKVAENCSFGIDIGEWLVMTKKDVSARACNEVAAAIRAIGAP